MDLKHRKACPLCQSENIKIFKKGTFDPESVQTDNFKITDSQYGSLWTFFSCKNCGFVFSNPYIPKENMVDIPEFLEDVITMGHRSALKNLFQKLGSVFNKKFGSRWMEDERDFWNQVVAGEYKPEPVILD